MLKSIAILLLLVIAFSSCKKDDENDCYFCEQQVVISEDLYLTAPNDHLVIDSLKINGDCLKINFSSSGCNGDSWQLKLIDQGGTTELVGSVPGGYFGPIADLPAEHHATVEAVLGRSQKTFAGDLFSTLNDV